MLNDSQSEFKNELQKDSQKEFQNEYQNESKNESQNESQNESNDASQSSQNVLNLFSKSLDSKSSLSVEQQAVNSPFPINASELEDAQSLSVENVKVTDENAKTKVTFKSKVSAKLVFPKGGANVREFEIVQEEISIGRGKDCEIILNDKKCSRKHAIIQNSGLSFLLKDLGSSNGTYVNGERITERVLKGDETIQIGDVQFTLLIADKEYAAKEKEFLSVADIENKPDKSQDKLYDQPYAQPMQHENINFSSPNADVHITGMQGLSPQLMTSKKQGLFKKIISDFRTLTPIRLIIYAAVLVGTYFVLFVEELKSTSRKTAAIKKETKKNQSKEGQKVEQKADAQKIGVSDQFAALSEEQKKYVEARHKMAFEYLTNKEYDKAIFEIRKIFVLVSDYEDSKEIERYALEGKRRVDAAEEEKRKKEDEAQFKAKLDALIAEATERMTKKQYEQAQEIMSMILTHDPENKLVARGCFKRGWR
ncbi:MAG: FHA domain-containing protein [Deltaproteobacteria bacterium]|nr:FHA domain-containing protein [Deltaproteobacteria bacterium]